MLTLNRVIEIFNEINRIPRNSGDSERISSYLIDFAKKVNLDYSKDDNYNVIITKKATKEMKDAPSLILQSHTDMVCVKDEDVQHDFKKDPIISYIEDGFLKAKGTTLGADNGIGMAIMLAILESDLKAPMVECVFTSDEETNMTGAKNLDKSVLKSKFMINLDEETDECITVSSSGISDVRLGFDQKSVTEEYIRDEAHTFITVSINGLLGGHSGIDINLGRKNALLLMCELIKRIKSQYDIDIVELCGGTHMNAIPKDAYAILSVKNNDVSAIDEYISAFYKEAYSDCKEKEPGLSINVLKTENEYTVIYKKSFIDLLIELAFSLPCGVIAYDSAIQDLVETSANIGRIINDGQKIKIWISIRSSANEKLDKILEDIKSKGLKYGATTEVCFFEYGWPVNNESTLVPFLVSIKKELTGKAPKVIGIHAGLECGTFSRAIRNADICAMGPNIIHPHTTGERADLNSINGFLKFIEITLSRFNDLA